MSRRGWGLLGLALALLAAAGVVGLLRARSAPRPTSVAWPVMGTLLQVTAWDADAAQARAGLDAARAAVFRVDSLMSNYKPGSEISAINRRAGTDSVTVVSPETAEVLASALRYARLTGGALDVTVGPLLKVWGFYRHRGEVPPAPSLDSARALVGWRAVELDSAAGTVRLPRRGMELDFGAIAKGYAVDRGVQAMRAAGVTRGMVDLGGNVRVFGPAPHEDAWRLGVRDPRETEQMLGVVRLDSGAVATSGDYEQFFVHQGVRYSHIFDPRTGWPARGVAGTTVFAPEAIATDALSTSLFILGPDAGCRLARELGVQAVWVLDPGDAPGEAVVHTPGLTGRLELDLPPGSPPPRECEG